VTSDSLIDEIHAKIYRETGELSGYDTEGVELTTRRITMDDDKYDNVELLRGALVSAEYELGVSRAEIARLNSALAACVGSVPPPSNVVPDSPPNEDDDDDAEDRVSLASSTKTVNEEDLKFDDEKKTLNNDTLTSLTRRRSNRNMDRSVDRKSRRDRSSSAISTRTVDDLAFWNGLSDEAARKEAYMWGMKVAEERAARFADSAANQQERYVLAWREAEEELDRREVIEMQLREQLRECQMVRDKVGYNLLTVIPTHPSFIIIFSSFVLCAT
jgi:hypothetical protein